MAIFTRTWNAAYEASPADSQNASQGAARIREVKTDIQERIEVDHSMVGDTDDGAHKKITFVDPLAAKPTQANDESYLYSKDVAGTSELFYEDEAGNEAQISDSGFLKFFPVGAIYLSTAVTNPGTIFGGTWAQIANGRTLIGEGTSDAVYAAAATGGESEHTLVESESPAYTPSAIPNHPHTIQGVSGSVGSFSGFDYRTNAEYNSDQSSDSAGGHTPDSFGGDGAHNNMPPYLVVYVWERTA